MLSKPSKCCPPPPTPNASFLALPPFALGIQIGRRRDVALVRHALDDLLNELFELRPRVGLIAVGRVAEQPLDRLLRQDPAVEQGIENRVVQRLHRPLLVVHAVRVAEPAGQEQIGELRHQIFEIQVVQIAAGELRVSVFHGRLLVASC